MASDVQRVLICGFGAIGRKHFSCLRQLLPDAEISLLRSRILRESIDDVHQVFLSLDTARQSHPDLVVLAGPASTRLAQFEAFAPTAQRVLAEKPLAASLADAQKIAEIASYSPAICSVGYNLRFFPPLALARRMIQDQHHGRLLRLECHVGQHLDGWRATPARESLSTQRALGGGALRELSHEIDYCLWICGKPQTIHARCAKYLPYGDAEDSADLWLAFDNGSQASLHMDMLDRHPRRTLRALCENATIELDFLRPSLKVNGIDQTIDQATIAATYYTQLQSLIANDASSSARCADGVAVMDVIESAQATTLP